MQQPALPSLSRERIGEVIVGVLTFSKEEQFHGQIVTDIDRPSVFVPSKHLDTNIALLHMFLKYEQKLQSEGANGDQTSVFHSIVRAFLLELRKLGVSEDIASRNIGTSLGKLLQKGNKKILV